MKREKTVFVQWLDSVVSVRDRRCAPIILSHSRLCPHQILDVAWTAAQAHTLAHTQHHIHLPNQNEPRPLSKFVYGQSDKCAVSRLWTIFYIFLLRFIWILYLDIISSGGGCLLYTSIVYTSSNARRKKERWMQTEIKRAISVQRKKSKNKN